MMRFVGAIVAALALAGCDRFEDPAPPPVPKPTDPATIFMGGTIRTHPEIDAVVQAVVVSREGRVLATGDTQALLAEYGGDGMAQIDLKGATLFPGFVDSHAHLLGVGQRELTLDLSGAISVADLVARVAAEVSRLEPGAALTGRGWIETGWPEGRMPLAADLDIAADENPVILIRADGHALVANTAALTAAGIDAETPDPDGGRIERDENGAATGILVDNAMALVTRLATAPGEPELAAALATGAEVYAARGWTAMHNMSVAPAQAALMERLDLEGRLPIRIYNAFDEAGYEIAAGRAHETDTITNRAVKIYMDGALGSRGALLFKPYADQPETSGLALRGELETRELMERAKVDGVQLAIHAIGDKANADALNWIEATFRLLPGGDPRWRIEHAQIVRPGDMGRFSDLGVIASMQPSHAISDLKFAADRLGQERLVGAYAWRGIIEAGGVIAGGSDAPVEVGSPVIEFYAAVARADLEGEQGEGWRPEMAVDREDALRMFTVWPAYAAFMEDDLGTIEPGKLADFSVWDRDLMTVPAPEILDAQPVMTVVGGEIVWRAVAALTTD